MPDWVQYVRRHLALPELTRAREDEIVEDLARQLEDCYREALLRGMSNDQAEAQAKQQISDWKSLTSDIYRTNRRTAKPRVDQWADRAAAAARPKGGKGTMLLNLFTDIRQDFLYGLRMLRRSPGFTAVAVLTLALGIGVNTTLFSLLQAMVLKPLPYKDSHQLLQISNKHLQRGWNDINISYSDYLDYQEKAQTLEELVAFTRTGVNFSAGETPHRLRAGISTPGIFPLLGLPPLLGRTFLATDQQPAEENVVLINEDVWRKHYAGNPEALGKQAFLNGQSHTIIGVVPAIPQMPELWIPLRALDARRDNHYLTVFARRTPLATLEQVQTELEGIAHQLEQAYPDTNENMGINVRSLKSAVVEGGERAIVLALFGLVNLILLIACANVANLLLARTASRQKEIALRSALGAGRARILRQLLTESLLLGSLGGLLGLFFGYGGLQLLVRSLPPSIPRLAEITMDPLTLAYTAGISLVAGLLFGVAPAWLLSRADIHKSLKESTGGSGGVARTRLRSLLAISQIAVALMLLISAGLFLNAFAKIATKDMGFDPANLLTAETALPRTKYSSADQVAGFYRGVTDKIGALPGVESVGLTSRLFLGQNTLVRSFIRPGDPDREEGETPFAVFYATNPDYLRTLRVRLVAGRYFTAADEQEEPKVVIVSETLARLTWPEANPLGKQIRFHLDEKLPRTVVGVVSDTIHGDFDNPVHPQAYAPHRQSPWTNMNLAIRTTGDPDALRTSLMKVFQEADPYLPVYNIRTMENRVSSQLQEWGVIAQMLALIGSLALGLAMMGIYGVISYGVTQRTHEFGVRVALGASRGDILRIVLQQGLVLTGIGIGAGLTLATALSRVLASALQIINPNDVVSFAGVPVILAMAALLACYIPARRATKVDPMVALRYE